MYFDSNVGEMSIERNSWFLKLSKMSTHDTSIDRQFWVEKRRMFLVFSKIDWIQRYGGNELIEEMSIEMTSMK